MEFKDLKELISFGKRKETDFRPFGSSAFETDAQKLHFPTDSSIINTCIPEFISHTNNLPQRAKDELVGSGWVAWSILGFDPTITVGGDWQHAREIVKLAFNQPGSSFEVIDMPDSEDYAIINLPAAERVIDLNLDMFPADALKDPKSWIIRHYLEKGVARTGILSGFPRKSVEIYSTVGIKAVSDPTYVNGYRQLLSGDISLNEFEIRLRSSDLTPEEQKLVIFPIKIAIDHEKVKDRNKRLTAFVYNEDDSSYIDRVNTWIPKILEQTHLDRHLIKMSPRVANAKVYYTSPFQHIRLT